MHMKSSVMWGALAVLLLGAGCTKPAPTPPPTPAPTPQPEAVAPPIELPGAGLVAPAPTAPPPPDTPSVPAGPPSAADAVAPVPLPTASPPPTSAPPPPPEPSAAAPRVIRVTAKQWEWQPREIRVKKDERVILEVTNVDVAHGLAIPDLNINETIPAGATKRIELAPTKVGRFETFCSVYCGQGHRDMRGVLIVE